MAKKPNILVAAAAAFLSAQAPQAATAQDGPRFPRPEASRTVCTQQYDPVCARRGNRLRTFGNSCEARRANYRVQYRGECRRAGWGGPGWGRPGDPDRPQFCTREYAPVCAAGRSGLRTFGNACEADAAGYRIIYQGRC